MMSFVQGAIAAATTACLYRQITQAEEAQQAWENIALGANHLFLIAGTALREGSIKLPGFSLCAKAVFLMTPVVIIKSFSKKQITFEKSITTRFGQFYYLITSVSSVAMIALGNKAFGVAALSVFALDFVVQHPLCHQTIREIVNGLFQVAAIATFIGYAARLSTAVGQTVMMIIGMTVFLPKIAKLLPEGHSGGEAPRKAKVRDPAKKLMHGRDYYYDRDYVRYPHVCLDPSPSGRSPRKEGISIREKVGNLVPALPFDE